MEEAYYVVGLIAAYLHITVLDPRFGHGKEGQAGRQGGHRNNQTGPRKSAERAGGGIQGF